MQKIILFLILGFYCSSFSQEKRVLIQGKITDSLSVVTNANIVNLNSNQGTFSSDSGFFTLFVKVGDSLQISSIQHHSKLVFIKGIDIQNKRLQISLKLATVALDEFDLKRHNLSGRLGIDTKVVPTNRKDSLLRNVMNFSKINMKIVEADDYIDKRVRPHIVNTDPTAAFVGAGASVSIPFKHSERLWALRKELALKKAFPKKILTQLGEKFFFEKLKIPVTNYFHFLEYCNPLGIENLYNENKILEIITIFQRESISYLKIIKND